MRKTYAELREETNYDNLVSGLRSDFTKIQDKRAKNIQHTLPDVLMSGYAIFSLKYPSMLCFEQQPDSERENFKRLFHVEKLCSDAQMRRVLDDVSPDTLQQLFPKRFAQLKKLGVLSDYRFMKKYYLISADGVHYFQSKKINCERCTVKEHRNGERSYHHSMLSAALVHPRRREVFTLGGEAIEKQDGIIKNDCELNAAKRLQSNLYEAYKGMPFIMVEDALYANGPHIKQIKENGWDFIINVKPKSHKTLFKLFEARKLRGQLKTHTLKEGKHTHHFYWMNNVPLNNQADQRVNFMYYEEYSSKGKVRRFSWVTSIQLRKSNVCEMMRGGRARWKIENEAFNTLKNQGYHFKHNYGHGHNHLSDVMARLMLLAFLSDQMIQCFDRLFNLIWKAAGARVRIWETMRAVYLIKAVNSFNELLTEVAKIYRVQLE